VARSAPLIYLMPPFAGLAAWLAGGESFTWPKLLGAAITLGGVALAQFSKNSANHKAAAQIDSQPPID